MRIVGCLIMVACLACAATLNPKLQVQASGNVQALIVENEQIVAATSVGTIETFRLNDGVKTSQIVFPKIKDFTGEEVAPKVFSIDALEGRYVAVVQAENGARSVYTVQNGQTKVVIDASRNWFVSKAKFVDKGHLLIALLSNEIVLWDIQNAKEVYRVQANPSHFSDIALNQTRTQAVSSCESGELSLLEVASGKIVKVFKGGNVDNVYDVDFHRQKILGAGQDRRGVVYDLLSGSFERFDGDFLMYAGALSADETLAAFAFNEQNHIVIFDVTKKSRLHTLVGQKSTLNAIVFIDDHRVVSSSDDPYIMIWSLP
ncbi:MAG: hypothetical protein EOM49_00295 [Epsilonproteobacteria bacterium]|uniref:WD40 repeat domain-containing protein n=1 Tax=Sulfurospirillum sp. hDNRA2 TaxID=3237298 RepID=UPI0020B71DA5|nr:hypothetical protein [Sulfurospirillum sp. DNRA8]MCP3651733.1 hypothetical protein [Sulfurospirillum sp. DNRA8]MCR1810580.1 hypothetical protein [Sulfurospirillum sp. DNRA8]NCB53374.1 hypothetical protein [Campylobacterota bacterium]